MFNNNNTEKAYNQDGSINTAFTSKQLQYLQRRIYEQPLAPNVGEAAFRVSTEVPNGATSYLTTTVSANGIAKVIANGADDLPNVDIGMATTAQKIYELGCVYTYSMSDMEAAQYSNVGLRDQKARAAERAHKEAHSQIALFGSADYDIYGILTLPNVPSITSEANGTGPSTLLSTKTPDNMANTISDLILSVYNRTNGTVQADTVLLDTDVHSLLVRTRMTDGGDSVLAYLQKIFPGVAFVAANELKSTNRSKFLDTDPFTGGIAIAYNRNSGGLQYHKPLTFTQLAPQLHGLNYDVPCRSKSGGLEAVYTQEITIMDGLT